MKKVVLHREGRIIEMKRNERVPRVIIIMVIITVT